MTEHIPPERRQPPWLIVAVGAVALGGLVLTAAGFLIDRGMQLSFDRAILLALHGGPRWLASAMIDITALGGPTVLVIVVAATLGLLAIQRHWLTAALVLGGTLSGSVVVGIAKTLVGRARPMVTDHLVAVSSPSFPSGHAANSATVYLTLALLIVQIVERRALRAYILLSTALGVTAIGCSRVYLGVHWPSDVLAGWSFGALWAIAWWATGAAIRLRRAERSVLPRRE